MVDFEALQRTFENQVAQIECPSCRGAFEVRVADIEPGVVVRCAGCDMAVPLKVDQTTEQLLAMIKGDLAFAFKRAFKAIEDYKKPLE